MAEPSGGPSAPAGGGSDPLALGDSLAGFRIVGTEHAYARHYGAVLAAGRLWKEPFEATLGRWSPPTSGWASGTASSAAMVWVADPEHGEHP